MLLINRFGYLKCDFYIFQTEIHLKIKHEVIVILWHNFELLNLTFR
jgi:hypothetical protein